MTAEDMESRVRAIIAQQLGCEDSQIQPESSLEDDLGADSLDRMELVIAFEEEFGIEADTERIKDIKQVKDALEYVKSLLNGDIKKSE